MEIITFCYILALIFITYIDCIMKKVILALVASAFVSFAYAQDVNFDSFKRIESDKVLNLSADQIAKIKKLNKEVGPKFRAIGRSNLTGYEKGQKKRALALEHKAAIRAILSENQIKAWETHYGSMNNGEGLRGIMKDDYDNRLDQLEAKFEKDKEAIEKYQKKHLFGVCSGRPRCALFDLEKLKLDFYILSSGAMILDKGLNIIQDFSMKKEIVQQIFNEYKKKAHIILQTGNADVFYATLKEDYNPKLKVISSFKDVEHEIIYGISLVFKDDKITKKACLEINQKYQEVEGFQNRNSIDIVRKGCSKGTGIKIIKDYYHLEKVAGIGDSYNDLPMLKVVDTAFTFKTSPQEIQKQVHYCVNDIAEAIALLEVEK